MKTTNDEVISSWMAENLNPFSEDSGLAEATLEIDGIKTPINLNLSDKHIQNLLKNSVTYKAFKSFFSWTTCDTNESISNIFAIDLYSGRTVYLLQPGSEPIAEPHYMGYGKFGGKNAYAWLAEMNLLFVREYSEEEKTKAGKLLLNGSYFENTVTGEKWMYREAYEHIDLQRSLFPGIELLTMQTTMNTCDYENTIEIKFSSIYPILYPLKFSYDKNARYENFPASEVCTKRGIVYSEQDRYNHSIDVYTTEEEYCWGYDGDGIPPLLVLNEDKYCVRDSWNPGIPDRTYCKKKSNFYLEYAYMDDDKRKDLQKVIKEIKNNVKLLEDASDEIKNNRHIVAEAIKSDNEALIYASQELKTDRELVQLAILSGPGDVFSHKSIHSIYSDDEMIASLAIKQNDNSFRYISDRLKADREFVLEHIKYCSSALWYVSKELLNDKEIILEAVKHHFWAYADIPNKFLEDRDVFLTAVKGNGLVLMHEDSWINSDREMVYEAVKSCREAFAYASVELQAELQEIVHNSGNKWRETLDQVLREEFDYSEFSETF